MSFRSHLERISAAGQLVRIKKAAQPHLEMAGLLKALERTPVYFETVPSHSFRVAGNVFATKEQIAGYFGVKPPQLIGKLSHAIDHPSPPEVIDEAPCQQIVMPEVDLDRLPILFHCEGDGGKYITSGVCAARHPEFGQNLDFHRGMQLGKDRLALRVVGGRHFDQFLRDQQEMEVAISVGNSPNVLLAAAISVEKGEDELGIANSLEVLSVVRGRVTNLLVPAHSEFVLEGVVRLEDRSAEGPFVDLTETIDHVRQEPVMTVTSITCRRDAIWQALLSGGLEHKILMGMPREPTIFRKVREAGVECVDVSINPGGASWLHAIIKIRKREESDGRRALDAAFDGHQSLKHAFVVDEDIDILDPHMVEWCMATRFQFDRDVHRRGIEPGSSLDPSAERGTKRTQKVGFDLTAPADEEERRRFARVSYPKVNLDHFLN